MLLVAQCSDEDPVLSMTAATAAANIRGRFLEKFNSQHSLAMGGVYAEPETDETDE